MSSRPAHSVVSNLFGTDFSGNIKGGGDVDLVVMLTHLRCRPGKRANIVQRGEELPVHDLGQANICNLGCVVSRKQDVG